jgi:hypothetical protein
LCFRNECIVNEILYLSRTSGRSVDAVVQEMQEKFSTDREAHAGGHRGKKASKKANEYTVHSWAKRCEADRKARGGEKENIHAWAVEFVGEIKDPQRWHPFVRFFPND